jgi:ATP-dependent Clp protease ATP-binding subunit ClpA
VFENFSKPAREVVTRAQLEARSLRHNYVGTEHVLLGLLGQAEDPATRVLEGLGVAREAVREAVREIIGMGPLIEPDQVALEAIGIDLQEVRRRTEEAFGPGALERTHAARDRYPPGTRVRRRPRLLRRITHDCEDTPKFAPGRLAFTPRTKTVLELARKETQSLGHDSVLPGHLLLGLVLEGEGVAAQVLSRLGVDLQRARSLMATELDARD